MIRVIKITRTPRTQTEVTMETVNKIMSLMGLDLRIQITKKCGTNGQTGYDKINQNYIFCRML